MTVTEECGAVPTVGKIRRLRARAVRVPMRRPLQTSAGLISIAPLVLIDLESDRGVIGRSYLFTYTPMALKPVVELLQGLGELLQGADLVPACIERKLAATFRLLGLEGLTGMAVAGVDMAAWDALACGAGIPLVRMLGGAPRPVPAYNSNGLGIIGPERARAEARELLEPGFRALKIRLGYSDVVSDMAVIAAVRDAVPEGTPLMADYNQALTVAEATVRLRNLDQAGLFWVEEPTRFDDYEGHAHIRRCARTPIQLGENCWGTHDMARAIAAGSGDYLMPDAMKIGGVTGWLRAVALAEPMGIPISSHLYPEISAHLLPVTPTAHYLEYVDWAEPILTETLTVSDGAIVASERPGTGLVWDESAVAKFTDS